MKILLLTLYFEPDIAANAVIMTELAEELTALGHDVTVVTAFPHYEGNVIDLRYRGKLIEREERDGLAIIRTYLYTSANKDSLLVRLLNYVSFNLLSTLVALFSGPQDVVLVPSPPLTIGLSAYVVSLLKGIPYVYNVQDIYPDVVIKLGVLTNRWVIRFSRWLERFVYSHARHVIVLSHGFKENLLGKGVPEQKLTVIPNFVDTDFVRPLPRENAFRRQFGLEGRFVVLYAGNLGHSQDLETVLACAERWETQTDAAFVIVGDGSRKGHLQALAEEVGLCNVHFIPFQPRDDVPDVYAAADVCLVPLKEKIALDSVPSKTYTIMASARPIVASVDPGSDAWNLVEQAACGLCVPPEDPDALARAIGALYDDPELRREMGQTGREYVVAHHTQEVVARQYDELLREVAGE